MSARIREIYDAAGMRPGAILGATEAEIERTRAAQGVSRIPETVKAIWQTAGCWPGPWGSPIQSLNAEQKERVLEVLGEGTPVLRDGKGLLLLRVHHGTTFDAIDGADLHLDDPPVWRVTEGAAARQAWPSVTEWFEWIAQQVARYRQFVEKSVAGGGMSTDEWYYEGFSRTPWRCEERTMPSPNASFDLVVVSRQHIETKLGYFTFDVRDRSGREVHRTIATFEVDEDPARCDARWVTDDRIQVLTAIFRITVQRDADGAWTSEEILRA